MEVCYDLGMGGVRFDWQQTILGTHHIDGRVLSPFPESTWEAGSRVMEWWAWKPRQCAGLSE
jgi:hypothetical protein